MKPSSLKEAVPRVLSQSTSQGRSSRRREPATSTVTRKRRTRRDLRASDLANVLCVFSLPRRAAANDATHAAVGESSPLRRRACTQRPAHTYIWNDVLRRMLPGAREIIYSILPFTHLSTTSCGHPADARRPPARALCATQSRCPERAVIPAPSVHDTAFVDMRSV